MCEWFILKNKRARLESMFRKYLENNQNENHLLTHKRMALIFFIGRVFIVFVFVSELVVGKIWKKKWVWN